MDLLTVQNSAKTSFAEYLLRSARCDVKGRQSASSGIRSRSTAQAHQTGRGAITGVAFWRSGDRRLGRGHKSCSDLGLRLP